ncbi:MAG: cyclic nucleotide-binding domain-containing protein [Betaproteobacteria bacterium]|nr:cyclic nucleotide-binding domain-containing protein [Betaproteobacteria bacterium]
MNPTVASSNALSTRSITEVPELAAKAAELLRQTRPNFALTMQDATCIVSLMRLVKFPAGTTLFTAGDVSNTGYMLLLLEGDVTVDTGGVGGTSKVDIAAIGPGELIGELALIDGAPRSATCTAISPVIAAGLSSGGLNRLIEQFPQVANKLVIYIAQSAAERLRALSEQLQMYDQVIENMRQENEKLRLSAKR